LVDGHRFALRAGAETIVQMDADFSHDPADLPRLVASVREGADLVIGSRYCAGGGIDHWSWWRRLLSRTAGTYVRFWTGLPLEDPTAGFRAFGRSALESALSAPKQCDGYGFQIEMALAVWRNGGVLKEIPVLFSERREGCSKLSSAIILEAIFRVPRMR
jgi:dolichol-phosphate mannosyltransferase